MPQTLACVAIVVRDYDEAIPQRVVVPPEVVGLEEEKHPPAGLIADARRGVTFIRPPSEEPYGTVAVFEDLYGNKWDLIQPT